MPESNKNNEIIILDYHQSMIHMINVKNNFFFKLFYSKELPNEFSDLVLKIMLLNFISREITFFLHGFQLVRFFIKFFILS